MTTQMQRRAERIIAKTTALRELGQRHGDWIFTEIMQGDGLVDIVDDLMSEFEDPDLWGDEHGTDALAVIEEQYLTLVWHHIMVRIHEHIARPNAPTGWLNHPTLTAIP